MTGIDPSHVDLQHLANDHSTTRATGGSSYIFIVAIPFPSSLLAMLTCNTLIQGLLVSSYIFMKGSKRIHVNDRD